MTTVVSIEIYYYFNSLDVGNQLKYYTCQFALGVSKGLLFKFSCCLITWFHLVEALKRWNFFSLAKNKIKVKLSSGVDIFLIRASFLLLLRSPKQKWKYSFFPPSSVVVSYPHDQLQVLFVCKALDPVVLECGLIFLLCKIFYPEHLGRRQSLLSFHHNVRSCAVAVFPQKRKFLPCSLIQVGNVAGECFNVFFCSIYSHKI